MCLDIEKVFFSIPIFRGNKLSKKNAENFWVFFWLIANAEVFTLGEDVMHFSFFRELEFFLVKKFDFREKFLTCFQGFLNIFSKFSTVNSRWYCNEKTKIKLPALWLRFQEY